MFVRFTIRDGSICYPKYNHAYNSQCGKYIICLSLNFPWNQFRQFESLKNGHLDNYINSEFRFLEHFGQCTCKSSKFPKMKKPRPPKLSNGHFWDFFFAKIDFTENLSGSKILEFPHCVPAKILMGFLLSLARTPRSNFSIDPLYGWLDQNHLFVWLPL